MGKNYFLLNPNVSLPLHIGLIFSLAEGNKVAWIRDYPRLLRLVFTRKDFLKMKGGGGKE